MLMFKCQIPHTYTAGKSTRKVSTNAILSMHWQSRKKIHDEAVAVCSTIFQQQPSLGHTPDSTYRISLGFYSGKSTKVFDLDNLSILAKYAIDAFRNTKLTVDDNFHWIKEIRIVYLGKLDKEAVIFQAEQFRGGETAGTAF